MFKSGAARQGRGTHPQSGRYQRQSWSWSRGEVCEEEVSLMGKRCFEVSAPCHCPASGRRARGACIRPSRPEGHAAAGDCGRITCGDVNLDHLEVVVGRRKG